MSATKNIAASVRARLLNRARADKVDFNLMLTRFALERLLYRLSVSEWSNEFLLKGALLFDLWFDQPQRPTRDIDLLGFGPAGLDHLIAVFRELCGQACDDGMAFDPASVRATEIRKDANYEGVRVTLVGTLDGARCAIQVDVGYGDAVTPEPDRVLFPVVLEEMPAPALRVYPVYTVVAEKIPGDGGSRYRQHTDEGLFRSVGACSACDDRSGDLVSGDTGDVRAARDADSGRYAARSVCRVR